MGVTNKKLVIVGDGMCGKTCILMVYDSKPFSDDYLPTVYETSVVSTEVDGYQVDLTVHDTAGQEDYDRLRPIAYPETDVFLLCFSLANSDSLDNIEMMWLSEITHYCPNVPFVLVGNKKDLRDDPEINKQAGNSSDKMVTKDQGKSLADKIKAFAYVECSAKTSEGVKEVFETAFRAALQTPKRPAKKSFCLVL